MMHFPRKLAGLYPDEDRARAARSALIEAGVPPAHIELLRPGETDIDARVEPEGETASLRLARGILIGAAAGLALGAVIDALLYIDAVEDFLRMSLIGPLAVAVYGLIAGAGIGAFIGLRPRELGLASHIGDALARGQYVVIAHLTTRREREALRARLEATRPPEILAL